MGTHQPDRRLPLAQQRQDRRGQVQAATTVATGLACFIFRFLRRPLKAQAARLEAASAHWMRHTAGSNMTSGNMDIRHVRDNLGHESISTTNNYLHSEDDKRHKDTEEHHRLKW